MTSGRRRGYVFLLAAVTLIGASLLLYRVRPLAGITFGSGAIILVVLAHVGALAAVAGPFIAWRRRRRR
jgi:hypothetical protein